MKKLVALLSVAGMAAMWSGCGLNDPASSVDISISSIGAVAAGGGAAIVEGTIEADSIISKVGMAVLNSSDVDVTSSFTLYWTTGYAGKEKADLKDDMSTTVAAKSATAAGTYKLKITAETGSITSSTTKEFTVTSTIPTRDIDTATVTAGANQNATYGSSIDLDGPNVWKMAAAASNVPEIDLCYAYSGTDNVEKLFSPAQAKASNFDFAKDWTSPNSTQFFKTSLTAAQYNAISLKADIVALWNASSASTTSIACAQGDVFIAKTNKNATVLMLISSQTVGDAGTIAMKIAK